MAYSATGDSNYLDFILLFRFLFKTLKADIYEILIFCQHMTYCDQYFSSNGHLYFHLILVLPGALYVAEA